jgi:hypothetical protein
MSAAIMSESVAEALRDFNEQSTRPRTNSRADLFDLLGLDDEDGEAIDDIFSDDFDWPIKRARAALKKVRPGAGVRDRRLPRPANRLPARNPAPRSHWPRR